MAYLGRGLDKISNIEVLDNITFDGSSSYSITKGSVAFTPNSAQSCLISIDGVVQATNFTVSSSTIDFGVAVPSTSTCNFFLHYGTGVMTVPSDGSVTTAKLGSNAVTTAKITDANVTSAKMFSGFANGITMADKFKLSVTQSNVSDGTVFTSNLERNDDPTFAKIGAGMTESSGIFTYPTTGLYKVIWNFIIYTSSDAAVNLFIAVSSDSGSTYDQVARGLQGVSGSLAVYNTGTVSTYVNVTNSSTFRTKFEVTSVANSTSLAGNASYETNSLEFIRLGDSQ